MSAIVNFITSPLTFTLLKVTDLINFLLGNILKAVVYFFEWIVKAQWDFLGDMTVVRELWAVARDFTNMLFILFLIFIALAAVLSLKQYDWKKMLVRVIIVAFITNFSFAICQYLIIFSNSLAHVVLNMLNND